MYRVARAVVICLAACATAAAVAVSVDARRVRTEDRNGDGRPDAWRHYDRAGRLVEIVVDSNFDGRSDVEEYYDPSGRLIRRESDRNFNGQIDLVEEFDPDTHEHARSLVDVDYDGRADLLVLFAGGRPVFSQRARDDGAGQRQTPAGRPDGDWALAPLVDPFRSDAALRGTTVVADGPAFHVGLTSSGGLPRPRMVAAEPTVPAAAALSANGAFTASADLTPYSTRGPPPSRILL